MWTPIPLSSTGTKPSTKLLICFSRVDPAQPLDHANKKSHHQKHQEFDGQLVASCQPAAPIPQQFLSSGTGARVLRQDPVECLFEFLCSSNNHISRIHGMVERLCRDFGTPLLVESSSTGELSYTSIIQALHVYREIAAGADAPDVAIDLTRRPHSNDQRLAVSICAPARFPDTIMRSSVKTISGAWQ